MEFVKKYGGWILAGLLLLGCLCGSTTARADVGDDGWAEFAAGISVAVSPRAQAQFALQPRVFFNRIGVGGFVGLSGGAELDTTNIQLGATAHLYLWSGAVNLGPIKIEELHVFAIGKVVSPEGSSKITFHNNEKGIELRPDFSVGNKVMTYIQVTHQAIDNAADRLGLEGGAVFKF